MARFPAKRVGQTDRAAAFERRAWMRRASASLAGLALLVVCSGSGRARELERSPGSRRSGPRLELPPVKASWLSLGLEHKQHFRLAPPLTLAALGRYLRPWENHTPEWRSFFLGPYGPLREPPMLTWRLGAEFEPPALPITRQAPCPRWQRPRALTILRYAGEAERLPLFDCDGSIAPDVIDRLSALARAPDAPRPELPFPVDPEESGLGEWLPGVHLIDPRLTWVLGQVQQAFPGRAIVIMSGYRPDAHTSFHKRGKALDLYVQGVQNDRLFAVCRKLRDVGCGYYPNNRFVHIDVRPFGTGRVLWVDTSAPGEASRYADGYPGVLEPGVAWLGG